ncbi:hypothetical protein P0082_06870 [Candidatus Haliotispira prima]|uniref:Uncharacterized protein n=1 Tax=Candidatus Haliotispira prima TaxID=3034016 RepID=A0ABY8MG62_9SPIO|nr:hypothetical protein P0082_06870 [Candidatus Haliotispira prima]
MVSSVQLEMGSNFAITKIGAVIRLATETAPTKVEAEANAGYVNLAITANSPRKFSISQHYTTNFTDGLTIADVLASNTQYKLYLFFEPNIIPSETAIEGATLNNDVIALSFTTATLPSAGDAAWNNAWTNRQFVGGLAEWSYSENQKGILVVYTKINTSLASFVFNSRTADNTELRNLGTFALNLLDSGLGFIAAFSKLGGSYPDSGEYYYVISADDTQKLSGKTFQAEIFNGSVTFKLRAPLTRYSSPK